MLGSAARFVIPFSFTSSEIRIYFCLKNKGTQLEIMRSERTLMPRVNDVSLSNCTPLSECRGLETTSRGVVINGRQGQLKIISPRNYDEGPFRTKGINEIEKRLIGDARKMFTLRSPLIYGNRYLCFAQLAMCNFRMQRFHCRGRTMNRYFSALVSPI